MILKNYQKQKQGKQEKSESNLLFNRLCKNLWMIFANVIFMGRFYHLYLELTLYLSAK